jgi:hypothetical protein
LQPSSKRRSYISWYILLVFVFVFSCPKRSIMNYSSTVLQWFGTTECLNLPLYHCVFKHRKNEQRPAANIYFHLICFI